MTLQQLLYVLTVSDEKTMNKAAEKLFVSQPTLTSAIQSLEKELNIQIFNRTSHGVTVTQQGQEFLTYARQLYQQYELLKNRYEDESLRRIKFRVSCQHYSFATKAFVDTVKKYGTSKYDFAISETKTMHVIEDVGNSLSEIGILYLSNYNRHFMMKQFDEWNLEFHKLANCDAFVYLYKEHPLAKKKSITYEELLPYPNMTFDQGDNPSMYTAEEILVENEFPRKIGYTLCSGIISKDLNGDDYVVVPYQANVENPNSMMEIGYITRKYTVLSGIGNTYIQTMKEYFSNK